MKKLLYFLIIGILLLSFSSALIESKPRPQPNPLLQSEKNSQWQEVVDSMKEGVGEGAGEPVLNLTEEAKERLRLENNYLIKQKNNPELQNKTFLQYTAENIEKAKQSINETNNVCEVSGLASPETSLVVKQIKEVDEGMVLFILFGLFCFVIIIIFMRCKNG